MKSLLPSVIVAAVTLLGVWLIQHPPAVETFAATPNAWWLLYVVLVGAAAPFAQDFAAAWWKRSRGAFAAGRGLVAIAGQRVGGGWKQAAILLAVGVGIGWVVSWGLPKVEWKLPEVFKPTPSVPAVPDKPDRVAIFHESEKGELPAYISGQEGAAGKLRAQGIMLWMGDIDIQDGTNDVPEWAKPAIEEARKMVSSSGKALVVFRGSTATVSSVPATTEAILEACK